jgi:high-affinity iron transporter
MPQFAVVGTLLIAAVIVWQAVAWRGAPDPTVEGLSPLAVVMNTGILVFREGLEAVLVLAALTASLTRTGTSHWKPVALGAALSFAASIATWFVVVAIISSIDAPALHVQAVTGFLAIIVLLVIMNWFFHKVYWTGWIQHHNRRKQNLLQAAAAGRTVFRGLVLLGFTAVYREGFEVVLFLQSIRLRAGNGTILQGVTIGLILTGVVAFLTFVAHRRLPYKKMLVLTGVMLGAVLLVMVGEQVQEMQQAGWISATTISLNIPAWVGTWFAVFPNVEGIASQIAAGVLVVGSYFLARRTCIKKAGGADAQPATICVVPDCSGCQSQLPEGC